MLFNSPEFCFAFLPAAIVGLWFVQNRERLRAWFLLTSSVAFYGYWDWRFVPFLLGSILINWLAAKLYAATQSRYVIIAAIVLDLAALGLFKYVDFLGNELARMDIPFHPLALALPLGISFFTFHHVMYLVDLRRGIAPLYSLDRYGLYICFFPQVLSGPLVRWSEIMHQFALRPWRPGWQERWIQGVSLFVIGMAKKVFVANTLATHANFIFDLAHQTTLGAADVWFGVLSFTFQIYFDFSGYSDMAIGIALLLGVQLPINFDAPYRAASIADFWRRWHMTLSRFLRDYLYIALGGNRHGIVRQVAALLLTMSLAGLWHGAGWTFVAWGTLHGVALSARTVYRRWFPSMPFAFGWPLTFAFVTMTWVFFRAADFATAERMLQSMVGGPGWSVGPTHDPLLWPLIAVAAALAIIGPTSQDIVRTPKPWIGYAVGAMSVAVLLYITGSTAQPFIYFKF